MHPEELPSPSPRTFVARDDARPRRHAGLTDRRLLLMAATVALAALLPSDAGAWSLSLRLAIVAGSVAAWRLRRPFLLIAAVTVFTSLQAGAHWSSAAPANLDFVHTGVVTLASDPESTTGGVRVRADVDGHLVDLRAWGGAAGWLRPRLMGEVVDAEVAVRPLREPPRWLVAQGLDGRGTVRSVTGWTEGATHTRIANSLRRTIASGARSLGRDQHALFTGLVYGDDRNQSPLMLDDFDAAGLSHLVAVSGQNVAFVLAIAGPLLRRLGHRSRWCVVGVLLLVFATMTRFEPSVMRASVMAAIAATGALVGTAVPATRVLLLAGVGLLAWRPLLVHSVGFQLSVAASAGILLWSARLARAIPGPRALAEAIAVTSSAQLAVAPLLLWRFGGVPVAALPANLLAGPASGPVMMWGMTAGWLAGLVPDPIATGLHRPTRLGVDWIAGVARWSAALPLGELSWTHVIALGLLARLALQQIDLRVRSGLLLAMLIVLAAPAVALRGGPVAHGRLAGGTLALTLGDETIVVPEGPPQRVLEDLRRSRVGAIDLLVLERSSFANADLVGWLRTRHDVSTVWAPDATLGVGEIVPDPSTRHPIGAGAVPQSLAPVVEDGRLTLHVVRAG